MLRGRERALPRRGGGGGGKGALQLVLNRMDGSGVDRSDRVKVESKA